MSHVFNIRHREKPTVIHAFPIIFTSEELLNSDKEKGAKPTFDFGEHEVIIRSIWAAKRKGGQGFSL